jgi:hypothetical protein
MALEETDAVLGAHPDLGDIIVVGCILCSIFLRLKLTGG